MSLTEWSGHCTARLERRPVAEPDGDIDMFTRAYLKQRRAEALG